MKTFVVSAASIILVNILFCPMAMAFPTPPADLQMLQPDPSLPRELSAFFGKWESIARPQEHCVIVEKIDEEKASLYVLFWSLEGGPPIWARREAQVIKKGGKYKLWHPGRFGTAVYISKGEYLDHSGTKLRRVP